MKSETIGIILFFYSVVVFGLVVWADDAGWANPHWILYGGFGVPAVIQILRDILL